MKEIVTHSLRNGLKGAMSHKDPVKTISELDIDIAKKKVSEDSHSIWQILFHIVFWLDIFIENIKGNDPKWEDEASWPSEEHMDQDSNFVILQQKFVKGIEELNQLMEQLDLEEKLEPCRNEPRLQLFLVAITHNSYHTGS